MRKTALVVAILMLAGLAGAQSGSITTTFTTDNGGAKDWMSLFDIEVTNPGGLWITSFDLNVRSTVNTTFSIAVYVTRTTYVGKDGNSALWTKVAEGSGLSKGRDNRSPVDTTDFFLGRGKYGIAMHYPDADFAYANGKGTGPGGNQRYANADLSLQLGLTRGGFFSGGVYTPRVWSGTIYYKTVVEPVLAGAGAGTPGSTYLFSLIAPGEPKLAYIVASSFGNGPIAIDRRSLGLSLDNLLLASSGGSLPLVFRNYNGFLDAAGRASADFVIPTVPALKGQRIYTAFVTQRASAPSGVASISNTVELLIR